MESNGGVWDDRVSRRLGCRCLYWLLMCMRLKRKRTIAAKDMLKDDDGEQRAWEEWQPKRGKKMQYSVKQSRDDGKGWGYIIGTRTRFGMTGACASSASCCCRAHAAIHSTA
jgi:hypothetical protein